MAGAYSTDLRSRVLAAVEAGESPDAAARRFAVGRSTAYRWVAAAREEGRRAAKPMGGGPPRRSGARRRRRCGACWRGTTTT
jgi:transposase